MTNYTFNEIINKSSSEFTELTVVKCDPFHYPDQMIVGLVLYVIIISIYMFMLKDQDIVDQRFHLKGIVEYFLYVGAWAILMSMFYIR